MKVLFVNLVYGTGSTGKIIADIMNLLKKYGNDVKTLYGTGACSDNADTVKVSGKLEYYFHNAVSRFTDHAGLYSWAATRKMIREIRAFQPDLIHLHTLHGFYVNYEMLFRFLKEANIPVVWTLHDCWTFTGHCTHFSQVKCMQWQTECRDCKLLYRYPQCYWKGDVRHNFLRKKNAFTGVKSLTITTPSQWLADQVSQSFLQNYWVASKEWSAHSARKIPLNRKGDSKDMSQFKDKILLITGGTGSFGNAVLRRFLTTDIAEIRILSRDEKKQDDMRHTYQELYPQYAEKIKFYIGDVRDYRSIDPAFRGVDYVFHAAALKQVPSCEFYPMEAVKTNVAGSDNVISACVENHVKKAIFLSTDKAAYPINAMGMTKAVMEKNVIARSRQMLPGDPVLCLTRYGNVMASRGSVIPLFCDQIDEGKPLTITNPNMTRFMMTLSDAVDLVLYAFEHGEQGDLFVQKAPAATIETLAQAVLELKHSNLGTTIIGTRHGEKLFEVLVTAEEMMRAEELPGFFRIPADNRDLNYDNYFSKGNPEFGKIEQYTSHNTHRLNVEEMKQLLLKLKLFGGTC